MGTPALSGRDRERAALEAALTDACAGRGGVVLLSGPAGIGKSALLDALAASAGARGAEVMAGRAWEFADAPPYFPFSACFRALGLAPDRAGSPFEFWEHVLSALARRAATRPIVIALEDVHAADLLTLDLLVFLAQPARALPLLMAVTLRDQDPRIDHRGRARVDRLRRDAVTLSLEGLDAHAVRELSKLCLGREPSPPELARLVERSEGNPLYVLELARTLKSSRGGPPEALPPTIRQLVQERVEAFPAACRKALHVGAILGREFGAGVVARILDLLPARVIDDLAPALEARLLLESRPGVFVFSHVLERDAIESAMSATERAEWHARAEDALSRTESTPELLLERARHALGGLGLIDEAVVRALVGRAIASLESQGAHDRAYALWSRLDDARTAGTCAIERTASERIAASRLARLAGRNADAGRLSEEAIALARGAGDTQGLGEAVLAHGAELRPGVVDATLIARLEEARQLARTSHPTLAIRLQARLAAALQPALDPSGPVAMAREAIVSALTWTDDALALEVLENAGSAMVDYAPVPERLECARELFVRAERLGDSARALRALARTAMDQAFLPDLRGFSSTVDTMLTISRALGQPRYRWRPLLLASMRACMLGRFDESERILVELDELAALTDESAFSFAVAAHRMLRAREVGSPSALMEAATRTDDLVRGAPFAEALAAIIAASLVSRAGDAEATARFLAVGETALDYLVVDLTVPEIIAEAVARSGSDTFRRRLRDLFAEHVERDCPTGHIAFTFEGPVARLLGLLERSLGDLGPAEAHLRRALDHARREELVPFVARTAAELAELLASTGREEEARPLLEEAQRIAGELGLSGPVFLAHGSGAVSTKPRGRRRLELHREHDEWRVTDGHASTRLRDVRGMQLLARLAERPGEEVHVLALSSDEGVALTESHAGDQLDERARRAYRERLRELATSLEDARRDGDRGAQSRLARERDALLDALRGAFGLGGAARKAGSITERARVNVQRRLKDAVARIAEADPDLGASVARALRTGTYCSLQLLGS